MTAKMEQALDAPSARSSSRTPLRLGIMAMGGSHWIAGTQYIHSLLYGNSLLAVEERGSLRVYLDFAAHRISDYTDVRDFTDGVHITEFSSAPWPRFYYNLRSVAGIMLREMRWPGWPRFDLRACLRRDRTDVLFVGHAIERDLSIPQISWIPDFQHVHRPDLFSERERQDRDHHFARIMSDADRVVVSNQCSYEDAIRLFPNASEKIAILPFTMYLGRAWRQGEATSVVRKYRLPDKFLLFPSQFWKHKNHATVFRAIELLRGRGVDDVVLVCTGLPHDSRFPSHGADLRAFLVRHQLTGAVRLLGLLPRADQVQLMRAAAALLQPSLFEGWSAVVEEGRSVGKVIFASDIAMHREQLADNMHLFDPASAEALADLLARHWPNLTPGPHPQREATAEVEYKERIKQFARGFMNLCRSAMRVPA